MTRDRLLLIPLLIWGLVMVAPDLLAVVKPLGSFGFYVNNDGVIYDVIGPFADKASSPAWKAGLREGDQVDLSRLRCTLTDLDACGNAVAALGGLQFVLPGRKVTIDTVATPGRPAREFTIVAEQRPSNFLVRTVGFLDAVAGILIVTAAGWLVWTRPSAMTWGFFLYVNWFNPGQAYVYYAILQQWPAATIAQDIAGCIAQAAGYVGLLLFVIRAPNNKTEPMWRPVERALPLLGLVFAVALIASYAALIGYPTELLTRGGILAGFAVAVAAVAILADPEATPEARGLSAPQVGAVGLPDRLAVLPDRRSRHLDHVLRELDQLHPDRRYHRADLSVEWRALPLRVRGGATRARGQRVDSAAPRHHPYFHSHAGGAPSA